jgi:transcriptional antiterminator RfaH
MNYVSPPSLGVINVGNWLCLFTQPHRERLAMASLTEAGFEVYLPMYRKLVFRSGKRVPMRAPLFPRYIFARAGEDQSKLASAYRMRGVSSFGNRTLEQSLISDDLLCYIRARHDEEGDVVLDLVKFKPGQLIKILEGPFAGLQAAFGEPDDRKRSYILLDLLGKSHRVRVPNISFEAAA